MNKLFWFSIVVAIATTSNSYAKPQQYLECSGAGVQVDVGVNSLNAASDDLLLEVDTGSGQPTVYYATIKKDSVKEALESDLDFVDRDGSQGHATFKVSGKRGDLTYSGHSATVVCP